MTLLKLAVILVVVGCGLGAVNRWFGPKMQPWILSLLNIAVVLVVVLWLLNIFGFLGVLDIPVTPVR